jgi:hypothetical protein
LWLWEPCGASCDRREALINFNICSSGDRWITDLNRSEIRQKPRIAANAGAISAGSVIGKEQRSPIQTKNCTRRGLNFFLCRM